MPWIGLQCVIVVFHDHTHLLFDAKPFGNPDGLFVKMANGEYFTKIDLSKGYWQVSMRSTRQIFA